MNFTITIDAAFAQKIVDLATSVESFKAGTCSGADIVGVVNTLVTLTERARMQADTRQQKRAAKKAQSSAPKRARTKMPDTLAEDMAKALAGSNGHGMSEETQATLAKIQAEAEG